MIAHLWHLIWMRRITVLFSILFFLVASAGQAAHTSAQLLLLATTAPAGDTVLAGVRMTMEPGWHTYWKNPGAAGTPTKIEWQLPPGVTAGEIQWPLPEKLPPAEVTTYGYQDEVVLLVPLTLGKNIPAGNLNLAAKISWLECKESCIPGSAEVHATLAVGSETKASADQPALESWLAKVPHSTNNFTAQAVWQKPLADDTRPLLIKIDWAASDTRAKHAVVDLFPAASDDFEVQPDVKTILDSANELQFSKSVKKFAGDWPREISGVLVVDKSAYEVKLPVRDMSASTMTTSVTTPPVSLWLMLFYAFIGGLILNIMPCVLPVIALKILGFVSEAKSSPRRVRNLGLVYALGVIVSFLALAGIVIAAKAAGHHAGWGMQFGSPIFVVCLTTLVTLVALNLFGVFEVTLGGRALDAAGGLAAKSGAPGAFFNGLLATILATPCTAPFLAPALGFAFLQPTPIIVLIFLSVGLGLASPYVLLSFNPSLLKFLPKPGAWMEKFKIAMGFPMLATVVWLFNVAASDYGERVFWLGIFLVIVALAAWIFGEFFQRGRNRKGTALAIALILLAGGYSYALENRLHWREMISGQPAVRNASDKIDWQPWSPEAVAQARAAGKTVLVDFTATWCVTCNAIVKPALENDSVVAELKKLGTVTLLADYTRTPPEITEEISRYGGAGVPLVLVYPKNPALPPAVLPQPSPLQLPSSYAKAILDALNLAGE